MTTNLIPKQSLREEIEELRFIGAQMSNACFNLGQRAKSTNENVHLTAQEARNFDELRVKWDAIKKRDKK